MDRGVVRPRVWVRRTGRHTATALRARTRGARIRVVHCWYARAISPDGDGTRTARRRCTAVGVMTDAERDRRTVALAILKHEREIVELKRRLAAQERLLRELTKKSTATGSA